MKKKLKWWQIALLVIFYPVGIAYLIYIIVRYFLNQKGYESAINFTFWKKQNSELTVYITENSKVCHLSKECLGKSEIKSIPESEAIARGLRKCKNCFSEIQEEIAKNDNIIDIIECSLMGCLYPNPDGTIRQTYLINSKVGEDLVFKAMPTEEYPDTVGVLTKKGCIGVLPYQVLNQLRGLYAHNKASAIIKSIDKSERGLGCTIKITIYK